MNTDEKMECAFMLILKIYRIIVVNYNFFKKQKITSLIYFLITGNPEEKNRPWADCSTWLVWDFSFLFLMYLLC